MGGAASLIGQSPAALPSTPAGLLLFCPELCLFLPLQELRPQLVKWEGVEETGSQRFNNSPEPWALGGS